MDFVLCYVSIECYLSYRVSCSRCHCSSVDDLPPNAPTFHSCRIFCWVIEWYFIGYPKRKTQSMGRDSTYRTLWRRHPKSWRWVGRNASSWPNSWWVRSWVNPRYPVISDLWTISHSVDGCYCCSSCCQKAFTMGWNTLERWCYSRSYPLTCKFFLRTDYSLIRFPLIMDSIKRNEKSSLTDSN